MVFFGGVHLLVRQLLSENHSVNIPWKALIKLS
jgi:hypothetical protein